MEMCCTQQLRYVKLPWDEDGNGGGGWGGPPTTAGEEPPEATAVPGYGGGATLEVEGDDIMLRSLLCELHFWRISPDF